MGKTEIVLWKRWNRLGEKRKWACGKNGNRIGREIRNGLRRLLAEKEAIRKRGEALGCYRKKGECCLAAVKKGGAWML